MGRRSLSVTFVLLMWDEWRVSLEIMVMHSWSCSGAYSQEVGDTVCVRACWWVTFHLCVSPTGGKTNKNDSRHLGYWLKALCSARRSHLLGIPQRAGRMCPCIHGVLRVWRWSLVMSVCCVLVSQLYFVNCTWLHSEDTYFLYVVVFVSQVLLNCFFMSFHFTWGWSKFAWTQTVQDHDFVFLCQMSKHPRYIIITRDSRSNWNSTHFDCTSYSV